MTLPDRVELNPIAQPNYRIISIENKGTLVIRYAPESGYNPIKPDSLINEIITTIFVILGPLFTPRT